MDQMRLKWERTTFNKTYYVLENSLIWFSWNRSSFWSNIMSTITSLSKLITSYRPLYIYSFIHSFIHSVVCLTTGPKPLPKWALHKTRSRASSFKWEYLLLSLKSSSGLLRLLPRLPVTFIPPFYLFFNNPL